MGAWWPRAWTDRRALLALLARLARLARLALLALLALLVMFSSLHPGILFIFLRQSV
jgi:hypothetical protein